MQKKEERILYKAERGCVDFVAFSAIAANVWSCNIWSCIISLTDFSRFVHNTIYLTTSPTSRWCSPANEHTVEKAGERIWMFPLPFTISMRALLRCQKRDGLAANRVYQVHLFCYGMLLLVSYMRSRWFFFVGVIFFFTRFHFVCAFLCFTFFRASEAVCFRLQIFWRITAEDNQYSNFPPPCALMHVSLFFSFIYCLNICRYVVTFHV